MLRFKAAASRTLPRSPSSGIKKNPLRAHPTTAPRVLTAYRSPMRRPSEANRVTENRLRTGSVAPMSAVGTRITAKHRRNKARLKMANDASATP